MSEIPKDRTSDEDVETTQKPGESDTDTEGGFPKEAPDSTDDAQQSKQNE